MVTVLVTVTFFATISGCDFFEPDIDEVLNRFDEFNNITIDTYQHIEEGDMTMVLDTSSMYAGDLQKHEAYVSQNEESMEVLMYFEYFEETFNVWSYVDDELMYFFEERDLAEDDWESDPFDIMELHYYQVSEMDPAWFVHEGDYFTIAEAYEEDFLTFISDDEFDPEEDEIIELTVKLTEDAFSFELILEENGNTAEISVYMHSIGETTVELPEKE